jgi:hypothetical protein
MPSACGLGLEDALDRRCRGSGTLSSAKVRRRVRGLVDWVRLEHAGVLAVQHLESVEQIADPGAAVLDVRDAQAGVSFEELVGDENAGEVVDEPVLHEHRDDGRVLVDGIEA